MSSSCQDRYIVLCKDLLFINPLGQNYMFDVVSKNIIVTPRSTAGSVIGTTNFFINDAINITKGSLLTFHFDPYYSGLVMHNFSGESLPAWHNIHPTFQFTANNTFSSHMNYYSLTFNASSLAKLRDTPSAQCTDGTTRYLILTLNLVLTSDSLYHLADHSVHIEGYFMNKNFDTRIILKVEAGMCSVNSS